MKKLRSQDSEGCRWLRIGYCNVFKGVLYAKNRLTMMMIIVTNSPEIGNRFINKPDNITYANITNSYLSLPWDLQQIYFVLRQASSKHRTNKTIFKSKIKYISLMVTSRIICSERNVSCAQSMSLQPFHKL